MTNRFSRRKFLSEAGRSAAVLGGLSSAAVPPALSSRQQARALLDLPTLDGTLLYDDSALATAGVDQGRTVTRRPRAVLRPGSVQDVVRIVRYAYDKRIPIAMRGRGHSRYGVSLVENGIVIDSRSLDKVLGVTPDGIDVEAGCALSTLVAAANEAGYAIPVMTDCTMLSVGGFLSVGGQAQGSQRFGAFVDQVRELDVVTGDGRLVTCSESRERELFEMTLAGLGQCGIVTRAKLRVVRAPQQVVTRTITFETIEPFLAEQERLLDADRLDIMVGTIQERLNAWVYVITVGGYDSGGTDADPSQFLARSGPGVLSDAVRQSYQSYFSSRNLPTGPSMPGTPTQQVQSKRRVPVASPSLAVWLPASATRELLAGYLSVPADAAGINAIECTGLATARFGRPLFRVPEEKHMFAFWTLRAVFADSGSTLDAQLAANGRFLARALSKGAKRYPPYGNTATAADWRAHYGDALYRRFRAAKLKYDPRGLLTPGAAIFAQNTNG